MILTTPNLLLQPFTREDIEALHQLFINPGVRRYLWDDVIIDRETVAQVVEQSLANWSTHGVGMWTIAESGTPQVIGLASQLDFAFAILPACRIAGRSDPPNAALIRVLQKL